jgi:molybdenum cofactor cytidylyltransferase
LSIKLNKPKAENSFPSVAAVLLAAGHSRRMQGRFKPLLPFGGRTIIEACIENLRAAGITEIVVVIGHRSDELRARLAHQPVWFALNEKIDSEMSESIRCGVSQLPGESEAVLIALGDQPQIPPDVIRQIVGAWLDERSFLVAPEWRGETGHPVLVDLKFGRDTLLNLDPQRGLRALFDDRPEMVRRVGVNSPQIARDIDTWGDYCVLHEEVFGYPPRISRDNSVT